MMVAAKVEASDKRAEQRQISASRAMLIGERHILVAMRQIGAEHEQLHQGQYRRQRPKDDDIE